MENCKLQLTVLVKTWGIWHRSINDRVNKYRNTHKQTHTQLFLLNKHRSTGTRGTMNTHRSWFQNTISHKEGIRVSQKPQNKKSRRWIYSIFLCQKVRNCSKNNGVMPRGPKNWHEETSVTTSWEVWTSKQLLTGIPRWR